MREFFIILKNVPLLISNVVKILNVQKQRSFLISTDCQQSVLKDLCLDNYPASSF